MAFRVCNDESKSNSSVIPFTIAEIVPRLSPDVLSIVAAYANNRFATEILLLHTSYYNRYYKELQERISSDLNLKTIFGPIVLTPQGNESPKSFYERIASLLFQVPCSNYVRFENERRTRLELPCLEPFLEDGIADVIADAENICAGDTVLIGRKIQLSVDPEMDRQRKTLIKDWEVKLQAIFYQKLPDGFFTRRAFDLVNAGLSTCPSILMRFRSLQHLNLQSNNLRYLPQDVYQAVSQSPFLGAQPCYIYLSDNPQLRDLSHLSIKPDSSDVTIVVNPSQGPFPRSAEDVFIIEGSCLEGFFNFFRITAPIFLIGTITVGALCIISGLLPALIFSGIGLLFLTLICISCYKHYKLFSGPT